MRGIPIAFSAITLLGFRRAKLRLNCVNCTVDHRFNFPEIPLPEYNFLLNQTKPFMLTLLRAKLQINRGTVKFLQTKKFQGSWFVVFGIRDLYLILSDLDKLLIIIQN